MRYRVIIEVDRVAGDCPASHKQGDSWTTERAEAPLTICPVALSAIWQKIYAMLTGANFWWADDPDVALFSCPDQGKVTFKISRQPLGE